MSTGATGLLPPLDLPGSLAAVQAARAARRRRRLGDVAWGDLAYRVYTTTLGGLVLAVFASGLVGDATVAGGALQTVRSDGPAFAGVLAAAAVLAGARSGARGGPLALEAADVHHLLLAPVPRRVVLRRPVAGVLGYGIAGSVVVGGLAGSLIAQRLPGASSEWILCGALFGAMCAALGLGVALLTASRALPSRALEALGWAVVAWSLLEATSVLPRSGPGFLGAVLFWPLRFETWSLVGAMAALVACALGVRWIGGLSMEKARRRTQLVGQLRFAVTQQDLRSVLLVRRQLAAERPRARPLLRLPPAVGRRAPVLTRDLQSVLRWPATRSVRILVLGVVGGLSLRGVWEGTTPLLLVAGVAAYLAALDALEPLAQEVDHPTLRRSYPLPEGVLLVRHLGGPTLVMVVTAAVGLVAAWAAGPDTGVLAVGGVTVLTAALAGTAGAAISIVSEVVLDQSGAAMLPPEVAGPRVLVRTLWPPVVATLGGLPVLAAQRAARSSTEPHAVVALSAAAVLVVVAIVVVWVRYRADLHRSMAEAMGGEPR